MYHNRDFIYEAVANLENMINIPIDVETTRNNYDAILRIKNIQFIVEAKTVMRTSNQGYILAQLEELRNRSNRPLVFIAEYISKEAAKQLKERRLNYIDIAGNAFINQGELMIYIEGRKRRNARLTNQSRAFQEAGVKIIFHLLSEAENLQDSYRTIAQRVGVSLGSVSNVMAELEELNYLIKTNNKRILKNKEELLERWLVEFNTVLKPRIIRSRMKFIDSNLDRNWENIYLDQEKGSILWGGEPAGAILTNNLRPQEFIIYSNLELPDIAKTMRLVPDKKGNVEVRKKFWKNDKENERIAPPLLIYTDLMNSGYGRNVEIANKIFENELQYIQ